MTVQLVLASIGAAGIGLTAAYAQSRNKRRIHFVENNELGDELDNLEIEVDAPEECLVCGDNLDPEDVGAVVRKDDEYKAVCEKQSCLDTYDIM